MQVYLKSPDKGLTRQELAEAVRVSLIGISPSKVLLIPPDITRLYSGAGELAALYYAALKDSAQVHVLPALGTHRPMTREEQTSFFGEDIPESAYLVHNWRAGVEKIGTVPAAFVKEVSDGLMDEPIDVEISAHIAECGYDLIISLGQVVPHEVAGMANYSKNILVGCGAAAMIGASHMLGAFYGIERIMGRDHAPVRKVFDYAQEHFLNKYPLIYALTVTTRHEERTDINGLFIGRLRDQFEEAVKLSQQLNINFLEKPLKKCVVYLDPREFRSTWLGNKAVYRTRMAMASGGELVILAPGIDRFGEDEHIDALIRKYGYSGRERVLSLCKSPEGADLRDNLSAAAHLIHGSADGRFRITLAAQKLTRAEVEGVYYHYMDYGQALEKYDPDRLAEGMNRLPCGEEIFFISNPALGLWADKNNWEGGN